MTTDTEKALQWLAAQDDVEAEYVRRRIAELEAALRTVDDDVRHHLRGGYEAAGEAIPSAMIRPRAIKVVRDALGLSKR